MAPHGRRFTAAPAPAPGMRQFLRFGAVNYVADVFLDGRKVGHHEGGFTPFAIEVTGKLRSGDDLVVVGADSASSATLAAPPTSGVPTGLEPQGPCQRDLSARPAGASSPST